MTHTNTGKQPAARGDSNVIPFPGKRAPRQKTVAEEMSHGIFSLPFYQVLRKTIETVLRVSRMSNEGLVQRKRGCTTASAARSPEHPQPTLQGECGNQVRKRMSV